jgi:hypothetical protein
MPRVTIEARGVFIQCAPSQVSAVLAQLEYSPAANTANAAHATHTDGLHVDHDFAVKVTTAAHVALNEVNRGFPALVGKARKNLGTALRASSVRAELTDSLLKDLSYIADGADAYRHLSTIDMDKTLHSLRQHISTVRGAQLPPPPPPPLDASGIVTGVIQLTEHLSLDSSSDSDHAVLQSGQVHELHCIAYGSDVSFSGSFDHIDDETSGCQVLDNDALQLWWSDDDTVCHSGALEFETLAYAESEASTTTIVTGVGVHATTTIVSGATDSGEEQLGATLADYPSFTQQDTHSPYFSGGMGSPKPPAARIKTGKGRGVKISEAALWRASMASLGPEIKRLDQFRAERQTRMQVCNVVAPAMGDRHTTPVRPGGQLVV